jgi:hypothetical protein
LGISSGNKRVLGALAGVYAQLQITYAPTGLTLVFLNRPQTYRLYEPYAHK